VNRSRPHTVAIAILAIGLSCVTALAQEPFDRQAFFAVPDFEELPPDIEVVSEKTEDGVKVTEMYLAGVPLNGKPTRVYGFYCRPAKDGKYPAVIEIHGAGFGGSQVSPAAGIAYAKKGFACFVMDWAGPTDKRREMGWRHSEFSAAGNLAAPLPDQENKPWPHTFKIAEPAENGIVNAVRFARRIGMFLRSRPEVNPDQLCVSGMSAGAHLTLLLLGVDPTIRAAAVKYGCGFIDDIYFGGYFGPLTLCPKAEQDRWLAVLDPKHGLRDYRTSTLILSGTDDRFFCMPAVLQTWRVIPAEKRLIMRPNDDHSLVNNVDIPAAWFQSVLNTTPAWPTITPLTTRVADDQLTLRVQADSQPGIERVDIVVKRQPAEMFKWGRDQDPVKNAKWDVQPAALEGDAWTLTLPAPVEGEQLVAYATAYDKLGREVSSDTVELPDYPKWRGLTYEPWEKVFKAGEFQRCELSHPEKITKVRDAGNLSGRREGDKWDPIAGWFEYDFRAPFSGWYELIVPGGGQTEYTLDGQYAFGVGTGDKVGNFYLEHDRHTLRIQRTHWTGMRAIEGFTLRAVPPDKTAGHVRVTTIKNHQARRLGEEIRLRVRSGRLPKPATLTAELVVAGEVASSASVELCDWPSDEIRIVPLACSRAGGGVIRFKIDGREVDSGDLRPISVQIIDTAAQPSTAELRKELLAEIDCATTPPDYFGGGETRVVEKPFGAYRESGEVGWLQHMDSTNPSWFAYSFTVPEGQQPYYFEIDYPDDQQRTFCLAVREATPGAYPTTAGADTGGEYALSNSMQTQTILHWARGTEMRLLCITPSTGYRAAAARIRLYRLPDGLSKLPAPSGRGFGNWYEEGGSMLGVYAAPNGSLAGSAVAADRWAQSVAFMGGDTLIYTMAIYQFGLYPSRYNVSFCSPSTADVVGTIVLACERAGLKFFGEFHPEARELNWPVNADPERRHQATHRSGRLRNKSTEPIYNPLWPANREWYLGMIAEFAERYRESPAFQGVSLRLMSWANPGLNNFQSADWGYDDDTIGLFSDETGITPEVDAAAADRHRQRYDWLKANAWQKWLDWRCAKITGLHAEIAAMLRDIRPDLQLLLNGSFDDLRGSGIDPAALSEIPGLPLIGGCPYGRRGRSVAANIDIRDALIDPDKLTQLCPPNGSGAFMFGAGYFEATGVVVPPEQLGFDAKTKRHWMSGVVNPAGRNYLERYALALAEADAQFLADGGNAYTLGQPLLRGFLKEYRALPAVPFTPVAGARDPVAVWQGDGGSHQSPVISHQSGRGFTDYRSPITDHFFYAVNRESYPVTVKLAFDGDGPIERLATGDAVELDNGVLTVTLPPFGLLTYSASPARQITGVTTIPPAAEQEKARRVSDWLTRTAAAADNRDDLQPADKQTLREAAQTVAGELAVGHLWRVKALCQTAPLQQIFQKMLLYPPLSYPRPALGPMTVGGRYTRQGDFGQPETLAASLRADGTPGFTATVPGQESLGALATWGGSEAELPLGFEVAVPQRYRLWARLAVGENCANVAVVYGGNILPLAPRDNAEPNSGLVVRTVELGLLPGNQQIVLRAIGDRQAYLDQLYLEPLYTPVEPLAFAAYFSNPDQKHWSAPLPPETAAYAPEMTFAGTDGKDVKQVRWEPYPGDVLGHNHSCGANGAWATVRCPPGPLGKEVVAYCRTTITAPSARPALIRFGATSQIRLFVNGELIVDSVEEKLNLRWNFGMKTRQINLKAGENILLVKLGNAGDTDPEYWRLVNFHADITDPGDLEFDADVRRKE
jgi:dienelactone hydrolase